jgi:hypothetical protein
VRKARAISRYRSSARSNGRNNLPRLDESDEAVAFLACTKSTFSVFRIPTQNRRKFPKNEEFLAREDPRARGESHNSRIFSSRPGTRKTPPWFRRVPFSFFPLFRTGRPLTCRNFNMHDMRTADAHIRNRSRENLRELRERVTRRADRTRGHLAARDARPRDARARGLESRGLGGGGVSEMHGARYGSAPPSAAATDTASPETTPLHGVPCRILYSSA